MTFVSLGELSDCELRTLTAIAHVCLQVHDDGDATLSAAHSARCHEIIGLAEQREVHADPDEIRELEGDIRRQLVDAEAQVAA